MFNTNVQYSTMKKVINAVAALGIVVTFYACDDKDNTTTPLPLTESALVATINSQGLSTSGGSIATGSFAGNIDRTASTMSYTVTYSGLTPTAITLDPVSYTTSSSSTGGILLAGSLTSVGSGTSTTPGSGTSTGTGSGTSTTPGSGTSTGTGSGTSTGTGSGSAVTLTSPLTGSLSVSPARADSLLRGLYRINIRSAANPNGEIGGIIQTRQ
jgi:hypothetical protein